MNSAKPLLLLDLDNTLWDFDANAEEALSVLFHKHHLHLRSRHSVHHFIERYKAINKTYWKRYEANEVSKDELRVARFTDTFLELGIPLVEHPENIWEEYLEICPVMTRMMPGALTFLAEMKVYFVLGLVTNGFDKTQNLKINTTGINEYIDFMVTSESFGIAKPDPAIFAHAVRLANGTNETSFYLGDTWDTDVVGGLNAGIKTAWYNHGKLAQTESEFKTHKLYLGEFETLLEAGSVFTELANQI
jgi:putative hydrolase of the HAD superfamily